MIVAVVAWREAVRTCARGRERTRVSLGNLDNQSAARLQCVRVPPCVPDPKKKERASVAEGIRRGLLAKVK